MGYQILEFRCGTSRPQGYVLRGTGEHEGTNETIRVDEMMHYGTDGERLAHFLDMRFLHAHRVRTLDDGPPSEAETIAKGLTEAQRRALAHVGAGNGWGLFAGVRWDRRTRYRLFDLGLVAASRLTGKGRAVLANLKGE